jgi:hypothetical protein
VTATQPVVDWRAAQAAVATNASRVTALLRSVQHPDAPAVGQWNVTDVAAHISHAIDAIVSMTQGGGGVIDDFWTFGDLTSTLVRSESERDLGALADRIDASAARLVTLMATAEDDRSQAWLVRGIDHKLSTLTCHALNELVVHGRDIAVADRQPWPVDRRDARLIVNGFLFPVLGALGRDMVADAGADVRASFDIRVRGGGRAQFRFDGGDFSISPGPPAGSVDCHLSVDPTAFLLVAWNRISQWHAIPRGQLLAWGRKPWLGLKLRRLLKSP